MTQGDIPQAKFLLRKAGQEYGVTKRHAEALLGPGGAAKIKTLAQQQGLLHLEKQLCPSGACPWQPG